MQLIHTILKAKLDTLRLCKKVINKEKVDDIDLATNLDPTQVCKILKKENINYYETGIEHGTITAVIDEYRFEITSLRKDVSTDGRHANVKFSKNWKRMLQEEIFLSTQYTLIGKVICLIHIMEKMI